MYNTQKDAIRNARKIERNYRRGYYAGYRQAMQDVNKKPTLPQINKHLVQLEQVWRNQEPQHIVVEPPQLFPPEPAQQYQSSTPAERLTLNPEGKAFGVPVTRLALYETIGVTVPNVAPVIRHAVVASGPCKHCGIEMVILDNGASYHINGNELFTPSPAHAPELGTEHS